MPIRKQNAQMKELKALVKLMKASGISELKCNGIELKLSPHAFDDVVPRVTKPVDPVAQEFGEAPQIKVEPWRQYTDEQLATWSSVGPEDGVTPQQEQ